MTFSVPSPLPSVPRSSLGQLHKIKLRIRETGNNVDDSRHQGAVWVELTPCGVSKIVKCEFTVSVTQPSQKSRINEI